MEEISIDIGSLIEYTSNKLLSLIGKDAASLKLKADLDKRVKNSIQEASTIQCIGMPDPIPIEFLFQPPELSERRCNSEAFDLDFFLKQKEDCVILGGPGAGKSVLINWILLQHAQNKNTLPILFRLRKSKELEELNDFIRFVIDSKAIKKSTYILLLVDGYDEINPSERIETSRLLSEFSSSRKGHFVLTCRLYYEIIDLKGKYYQIQSLKVEQSYKFISKYLNLYKIEYSSQDLMSELETRNFSDFLTNPLMLTLICVLKTGPMPSLPKNTIGLIERAIRTLTYRWDDSRGIARQSSLPIDGEDRIRCIMRVAYSFDSPIGKERLATKEVKTQLSKLHFSDVDPLKLLQEIAQWYGIFVPIEDDQWTFTHRTIHDYLAAKFWVESGSFRSGIVSKTIWDTRTAYAACIIPDATKCLENALRINDDEHVLVECINNNAAFDSFKISKAIHKYFENHTDKWYLKYNNEEMEIRVELNNNYFPLVSDDFLENLVKIGSNNQDNTSTLLYLIGVNEVRKREMKIKTKLRSDLENYKYNVNGNTFSFLDINKYIEVT